MKKNLLIIAIAFFSLISCNNNLLNKEKDFGVMKVSVEGVEINKARAVIPKDYAKENSNRYDLYLYNSNEKIFIPITKDETECSVPAGIYNLLLLAGYQADPSYIGCLLGSAFREDIEIKSNQCTQIKLTILPISDSITAPENVLVNEIFTVTTEYDDRNPLIKFGPSSLYYEYENFQFPVNCEDCPLTGWPSETNICTFQIKAPGIQTKLKVYSYGRSVFLYDDKYDLHTFDFGSYFQGGVSWSTPSFETEGFALAYVNVELDMANITVTATWGD